MGATPCFWVDETCQVELALRRFVFTSAENRAPCAEGRFHNASAPIGRAEVRLDERGYLSAFDEAEYAGDERWPTACEHCGYLFADDDERQVWQERVYRGADGSEYAQHSLPPGAMLDAPWQPNKGPDGIALVVICPPEKPDTRSGWWHVDGPAWGDGKMTHPAPAWTRTGDPRHPETLSITPSIQTADYHGVLTSGVLNGV